MKKVAHNQIVEAMQKMKSREVTGPSEVSVEMIVASGESDDGTLSACIGW